MRMSAAPENEIFKRFVLLPSHRWKMALTPCSANSWKIKSKNVLEYRFTIMRVIKQQNE